MAKKTSFKGMKVLIVEDDDLLRRSLYDMLAVKDCEVLAADSLVDARTLLKKETFDVMISDMRLPDGDGLSLLEEQQEAAPGMEVVMMTAYANVDTAVKALKFGAFDYLSKPVEEDLLCKVLRNINEKVKLSQQVESLTDYSMREFDGFVRFDQMIGTAAMSDIFQMAERVAKSEATVLVQGESGSGKGMLSKAIHRVSPRAKKPFVEINCSAIPEHLLESELFGYEKGAFTDAKGSKLGLFEVADGGTVFLDEIGDMPLALQAKILKVLEDQSFRRLGAVRSTNIDVRMVAATNRDLQQLVQDGTFREDLYYRLSVVPIVVPPLRQHRKSIEPLASYFLKLCAARMGKEIPEFSEAALQALLSYDWPGNIRELRNVIERGLILSPGSVVEADVLGIHVSGDAAPVVSALAPAAGAGASGEMIPLADLEKQHIAAVLQHVDGNRSKAAEILQIHRTTLYKKIETYGLGD